MRYLQEHLSPVDDEHPGILIAGSEQDGSGRELSRFSRRSQGRDQFR